MDVTRRDWLAAAAVSGLVPAFAVAQSDATGKPAATAAVAAPAGGLTEESLGKLLQAIGLKPTKTQSRYDFQFNLKPKDAEEWTLSMSAVLSADNQSVWVIAWLDELPRSARDVPRTALLKLLAETDRLGFGRFFSYIPNNRRFALQQVVDNSAQLTSKKFHGHLVGLGNSVMETYATWSTDAWKEDGTTSESATAGMPATEGNSATQAAPASSSTPARSSVAAPAAKPKTATAPTKAIRQ